jgi:hypothetical protein
VTKARNPWRFMGRLYISVTTCWTIQRKTIIAKEVLRTWNSLALA